MADQQQPTPPLWRVMQEAIHAAMNKHRPFCTDGHCHAAMLRAIAGRLADRQSEWRAGCVDTTPVEWLLAEADRAERGEG